MKKTIRKVFSTIVAVLVLATSMVNAENETGKIPEQMTPCTVIEFDNNNNPVIIESHNFNKNETKVIDNNEENFVDDEYIQLKEEFENERKQYETHKIELPLPCPGTKVYYGTDGRINKIEFPYSTYTAFDDHDVTLKKGTRAAEGSYEFGGYNVITITSDHVYGTGRFTVYGELASDQIGDHDNQLKTGDCATKKALDNPYDGTEITCVANNITKTLYKEDIGTLRDAIIDVWKWDSNSKYFGEYYNEWLSFANATYYYYFR